MKKPGAVPRLQGDFTLKAGVQLAAFLEEHGRFVPDFLYMIPK